MQIKIITNSEIETINLGEKISSLLFPGAILTLDGDLGAGKTTFAKGIAKCLNIKDDVNSPTFNILKCYFNKNGLNFYHIDAYRLEDVSSDNKNIGLEEVIEGDGVCYIEWPKFISEFIPENKTLDILVHILEDNKREFIFSTNDSKYFKIIEDLRGF